VFSLVERSNFSICYFFLCLSDLWKMHASLFLLFSNCSNFDMDLIAKSLKPVNHLNLYPIRLLIPYACVGCSMRDPMRAPDYAPTCRLWAMIINFDDNELAQQLFGWSGGNRQSAELLCAQGMLCLWYRYAGLLIHFSFFWSWKSCTLIFYLDRCYTLVIIWRPCSSAKHYQR